jgi:hypothetical protein
LLASLRRGARLGEGFISGPPSCYMCSLDSRTHTHDLLPLQPHPLPIAELPTCSTRYTLQDGEAMGLSVRSRA